MPAEPSVTDKAKDFVSAYGKKLLLLIAVIAVLYFLADFFVLSVKPVSISVVNAENQGVSATISIFVPGQTQPVATGSGKTLDAQLKKGEYRIEVSSGGYETYSDALIIGDESEYSVQLEKPVQTIVKSVDLSQNVFLGQEVSGTVVLFNKSSKNETVELAFEKDFEDVVTLESNAILVPSGQEIPVNFSVLFPDSTRIKDAKKGDEKNGVVRIKLTTNRTKSVDFMLLPSPKITMTPSTLNKQGLQSGTPLQQVGKISITNNNEFSVPAFIVTADAEDPTMNNWISFSKEETMELAKGQKDEIIVYISPPVMEDDLTIAGASKIRVSSSVFSKDIPLQLGIKQTNTNFDVKPSLYQVSLTQTADGYPTNRSNKITLTNRGSVPVQNIDVSVSPVLCKSGGWLMFESTYQFSEIAPSESKTISMAISAPSTAEPDSSQTCHVKTVYDNPVSGEPTFKEFDIVITTR